MNPLSWVKTIWSGAYKAICVQKTCEPNSQQWRSILILTVCVSVCVFVSFTDLWHWVPGVFRDFDPCADCHASVWRVDQSVHQWRRLHRVFSHADSVQTSEGHLEDRVPTLFPLSHSRRYCNCFHIYCLSTLCRPACIVLVQLFMLNSSPRESAVDPITSFIDWLKTDLFQQIHKKHIIVQNVPVNVPISSQYKLLGPCLRPKMNKYSWNWHTCNCNTTCIHPDISCLPHHLPT